MTQIPPVQFQSQQPSNQSSGMAIASMVLGIVALALFCVWYLSIPCAILSLIFGVIASGKVKRGEGSGAGMAKTGIILSIVALAIDVLVIIAAVVFVGSMSRFKFPAPTGGPTINTPANPTPAPATPSNPTPAPATPSNP